MTFVRENAVALAAAVVLVAIAVVLALIVASAMRPAGTATVSPSPVAASSYSLSPSARPSSAPPSPSPEPSAPASAPPLPTGAIDIPSPVPAVAIDGADPDVVQAIQASIAAIGDLETYRGEMEIVGRDLLNITVDSRLDIGLRAEVDATPDDAYDAQFGFQLVEPDGAAAVSTGGRLVRVGDEAWSVDEAGGAEPVSVDNSTVRSIPVLLPDGAASRMIAPFAGGFERVGEETRDGIATVHYRLAEAGESAYADVTGVDGTWAGDVWIAVDSGYLVEATVTATTVPDDNVRDVSFLTTVRDANDPDIEITPPA